MDKLEAIFAAQKSLNEDIIRRRGLPALPDEEWIQKYLLAMMAEMAEVLEETNYKWWKNPKPLDTNALREELADVLHFFVSACLRAGLDANELFARYMEKNRENLNRQMGTGKKDGYQAAAVPQQEP